MFHIAPGTFQYHLLKPETTKAITTKRHTCNKENTSRVTDCYNEYYMKKLNCSLPWIQNYNGTLQKCGSEKNLDDLIEIMMNLDKQEEMTELAKMGCTIPNCQTTKWNVVKSEVLQVTLFNYS